MSRKYASLKSIDNDRPITMQTDAAFIYTLQNGLLLALKEQGILSETQYRHAGETLKAQQKDDARKPVKERSGTE